MKMECVRREEDEGYEGMWNEGTVDMQLDAEQEERLGS